MGISGKMPLLILKLPILFGGFFGVNYHFAQKYKLRGMVFKEYLDQLGAMP